MIKNNYRTRPGVQWCKSPQRISLLFKSHSIYTFFSNFSTRCTFRVRGWFYCSAKYHDDLSHHLPIIYIESRPLALLLYRITYTHTTFIHGKLMRSFKLNKRASQPTVFVPTTIDRYIGIVALECGAWGQTLETFSQRLLAFNVNDAHLITIAYYLVPTTWVCIFWYKGATYFIILTIYLVL